MGIESKSISELSDPEFEEVLRTLKKLAQADVEKEE